MALSDLQTRLEAIDAELAALSSSRPGGGINIEGGGMGTVDHVGYRRSLYEERKMLLEAIEQAQGPWEYPLVGRPN